MFSLKIILGPWKAGLFEDSVTVQEEGPLALHMAACWPGTWGASRECMHPTSCDPSSQIPWDCCQ